MEAVIRAFQPTVLGDTGGDPARSGDPDETTWRRLFSDLAACRIAALDELYDLAAPDVYRLALWRTGSVEDAEDVVQDVFVKLAEHGSRLADVRRPRPWLLTVAHRCAVDCVRRRARRATDSICDVPYLVAPSEDPERAADAHTVSRLIDRLPAKQREVVVLRHFAGCTFATIGRITGVPTFTAASRYRLAIRRLRRLLEKYHEPSR